MKKNKIHPEREVKDAAVHTVLKPRVLLLSISPSIHQSFIISRKRPVLYSSSMSFADESLHQYKYCRLLSPPPAVVFYHNCCFFLSFWCLHSCAPRSQLPCPRWTLLSTQESARPQEATPPATPWARWRTPMGWTLFPTLPLGLRSPPTEW